MALVKMAAMKTFIVVILNESGSMQLQKNDVAGGYQNFIEEQKDIAEDQARFVLLKFNTNVTISHAAMPVETTPELTANNYNPEGGTALYDAVAEGIRIAEATVQGSERVLVLIITGGYLKLVEKAKVYMNSGGNAKQTYGPSLQLDASDISDSFEKKLGE